MIKVNLLPPEYRAKEHTPLPMLAGIIGGVTFTALVLVFFLYVHIQKLSEVNQRLLNRESARDTLRKEAKKADELTAKKNQLDQLVQTVKGLDASRVRWARPLDDISWIIHDADKSLDVKGWITSLDFTTPKRAGVPRPGQLAEGGKFEFALEIQGSEMDKMGVFRDQIKKKERWLGQNLESINPPSITLKDYKDYIPSSALSSKVVISLRPIEPPKPAPPAGAAQKAAPDEKKNK